MSALRHSTAFRMDRALPCAGLLALALLTLGCGGEEISTRYGRHRNSGENASVNGTDVLAEMFVAAGHDVHFRRTLVTSEMEDADIVVWTPDTTTAPSEEVCEWFDNWLTEVPGRTLVYVGRDFGAGPIYYDFLSRHRLKQLGKPAPETKPSERPAQLAKQAQAKPAEKEVAKSDPPEPEAAQEANPSGDEGEVAKKEVTGDQESAAKDDAKADGSKTDAEDDKAGGPDCEWFVYRPGEYLRVRSLGGPWSKEIDAAKTEIELRTRLSPHEDVEELLTSDGNLIVSSESKPHWDGSQIIYVINGSFLLNLPLVNHEHRKLAARLVEATGEPANVVFLESRAGGPPIDPPHTDNSVWTLFAAWPLGVILLQLAAMGVLYCFAKWPIFGHPRHDSPDVVSDFSKHVAAVGRLLARTKNRDFALARLAPGDGAAATTEKGARREAALSPEPKGN